ncbi:MAG: CotH kinase family protein [Lachnospiraceae bacterium]|nr:CotH kinase family protein [Lachnospiraceae bacterium]
MTQTYFIGKITKHIAGIKESAEAFGKPLSVISISMDQEDLFDKDKGIYVKGAEYDRSLSEYLQTHSSLEGINVEHDLSKNYLQRGKAWERKAHIDYFETNGTETNCLLQQDCGIRIQGNYSREQLQKSFRLFAGAEYGKKNFKYPFFADSKDIKGEVMDKFKTLVLRNGGNDSYNFKYKDIFMQSFLGDTACDVRTGRPCVVYLDGEYWGYYILQDDLTDNYLQQKTGADKGKIVGYKGTVEKKYEDTKYKLDEGKLPDGVTDQGYYMRDMLNYLDGHDLSNDNDYKAFMDQYVSEESMLDYFGAMIYMKNGYDWPNKNWTIWRTTEADPSVKEADGKWRFVFNDLDLTTAPTWDSSTWQAGDGSPLSDLMNVVDEEGVENVMKKLISAAIRNASFRSKLKSRVQSFAGIFSPSEVEKRGEIYRKGYGALYTQFSDRFNPGWTKYPDVEEHSRGNMTNGVYAIPNLNHEANIAFLKARPGHVNDLLNEIDYWGGAGQDNQSTDSGTNSQDSSDGTLFWEGRWTRGAGDYDLMSMSNGLQMIRDDANFLCLTVEDWSRYAHPVLRISAAPGFAENARAHVWTDDKTYDQYIYQQENPWVGTEIDITGLKGKQIYINANDATLVKIEIYERTE